MYINYFLNVNILSTLFDIYVPIYVISLKSGIKENITAGMREVVMFKLSKGNNSRNRWPRVMVLEMHIKCKCKSKCFMS